MTCPMRSGEPHSYEGIRTDRCYYCSKPRPQPNRDKQEKKNGLDTPAKKSVQTVIDTPTNHYVRNGALPMSSTTSLPMASGNRELLTEVRAAVERRIIEHQSEGRESNAPEGFTLELEEADVKAFLTDLEFCGCWLGPTAQGPGWEITSYWSPINGAAFYVDGKKGDAIPVSEAANVMAAISRFAELAGTRP